MGGGIAFAGYNLWRVFANWPPGCQVRWHRHAVTACTRLFHSETGLYRPLQAIMDMVNKSEDVKKAFGEPLTVVRLKCVCVVSLCAPSNHVVIIDDTGTGLEVGW